MDRRTFIHAVAATGGAGIIGLADGARKHTKENASVEWVVKGFTCITCAIGLETLLQREEGISQVSAEYLSGRVRIGFDSNVITAPAISRLIEQAGFQVVA
jgi:copper chaperone CopZ